MTRKRIIESLEAFKKQAGLDAAKKTWKHTAMKRDSRGEKKQPL